MNSMTPSNTTTAGQIDKAVASYRAMLEKHSKEFNSEAVQTVLGQSELADEQFAVFRKRVDAISAMIMRTVVKVNREQYPQEMLDTTGRKQYTDNDVVASMPKGEGQETEVFFFSIGRYVTDEELEKEYELRGLKPDPYAQAKVNQDDPAFADTHPNGTHWKDAKGNWCFSAFDRYSDERYVYVYRYNHVWYDFWWFAGVRK